MRAYPALLKLASLLRMSSLPGISCFTANWQASLKALLTESNAAFNSDVIMIGTPVFKQIIERFRFFNHPGSIISVIVHETQISL